MNVNLIVEEINQVPPLGIILERIASWPQSLVMGNFSFPSPGRFSYLSPGPVEIVEFKSDNPSDPFELLQKACEKYRLSGDVSLPVPFAGGWAGYLSYDLGRYVERLPDKVIHDIPVPLLRFGFYDSALAWDYREQKGYLLALEYQNQKTSPRERLGQLKEICALPDDRAVKGEGAAVDSVWSTAALAERMQRNIEPEAYRQKVAQAREYILEGDIFEVNLSQRFACPYPGTGAELYGYLARTNPADYACLLTAGDHAIVSASPELFLSKRGGRIITRPIKGTMPRGASREEDIVNEKALEQSEKDRAELNMIIDLERNDLGKICCIGSVEVLEERVIETHPTVFHAVATIAGNLLPEISLCRILRATFPGGSITGAPKIRAMEIIDELEPTARCIYTGSIGWIGVNGDMDLNIAIRTIILADKTAYLQAGGAVVADSDPQKEYEETLAKAAALLKALYVTNPQSF